MDTSKMRKYQTQKNSLELVLIIIAVVFLALLISPILTQWFSFTFDNTIVWVDLLSIFITTFVAVYILQILEKKNNTTKLNCDVLVSILKPLIEECNLLNQKIASKQLSYYEASRISKTIHLQLDEIISKAELIGKDPSAIAGIKERTLPHTRKLNKVLTTIRSREDAPNDYLIVKEDVIVEMSPKRNALIAKEISIVKNQLFDVWMQINMF